MIEKIKNYFQGVVTETKKVTWPTREQTINYTLTVVVAVVAMIIVFGSIDLGLSKILERLIIGR